MAWLRSVYFLDSNRGWVAGTGGTLLQTSDGGNTWTRLLPLTRDTLHDVYFADENVGWLVAERDMLKLKTNEEPRSYLLKTEDAGFSWRRVFLNSSVNARLVRMVFADPQHGWVFGESGVVFATNNGGANWARQPSPTRHLLLGGAFLNNSQGWLVGAGTTIVHTNDGGLSWLTAAPRETTEARFTAASFPTSNLGWAVGARGQILTTRDGGRSWHPQRSNVDSDLLDVKFIDGAEGWVATADGVLLHTNNAGAHWTIESVPTSHALQRMFFVDRNHGWAVGFGGTILRYGQSMSPPLKS
jgi:photosystem II stability/assembly factor-like uncharacterized protein